MTSKAMAQIHPVLLPSPRKRKNSPKIKSQSDAFGISLIRNLRSEPPIPMIPIPIKNNPQGFMDVYSSVISRVPPNNNRAPQIRMIAHAMVSPRSLGLQSINLNVFFSSTIHKFQVFIRMILPDYSGFLPEGMLKTRSAFPTPVNTIIINTKRL